MIVFRRKYFATDEEIVEKILEEAKNKGISVKSTKKAPAGAAAYYVPSKGLGGKYIKLINSTKSRKKLLEQMSMQPGNVYIPEGVKGDPFIVGHEVGHAMNERSKNPLRRLPKSMAASVGLKTGILAAGYKAGKAESEEEKDKYRTLAVGGAVVDNLRTPIEEHSASQRAIKMLKKHGASEETIARARKRANYNTTAYINPRVISKNKLVRKKVLAPLALNGGLYAAGKIAGNKKKNDELKRNNYSYTPFWKKEKEDRNVGDYVEKSIVLGSTVSPLIQLAAWKIKKPREKLPVGKVAKKTIKRLPLYAGVGGLRGLIKTRKNDKTEEK